jgi:peroxiredoxin
VIPVVKKNLNSPWLFLETKSYYISNMKKDINTSDKPTLQSRLDEKRFAWEAVATGEMKKIFAEGIETVVKSGVLDKAKQVGERFIDFSLKNAVNKNVKLSEYLSKGPVILTWYRGGWCPYCNITLRRLQEVLPEFKKLGANLLALTPELPDKSLNTREKNNLEFEVLSDTGNHVARQYGIVFRLNQKVSNSYKKDFDLHEYNGDDSDELPLPATYIIDTDGIIRYAFLNANHRYRAEPFEILNVLNEIKSLN